jgi:predicted homoserine dehydrogenase-like protein
MIIVDRALQARAREGNPIRVGMIGAGFNGRAIALQILTAMPGMELVGIANRSIDAAKQAYANAGERCLRYAFTVSDVERAIAAGERVITDDPMLLCRARGIDALMEVTGTVEYAARVVMEAFRNGKHVILCNAELDGTLGPILKVYADREGVILSGSDGDQPGVQMNLYRYVKAIGMTPLLIGNVKGLQDPYRTPATQEGYAKAWGQKPHMVTGFADGTKISFEQATVANATGFRVAKRGMLGYDWHGRHIDELTTHFDVDQLRRWGGIVDYVVGALPTPGVFILATNDHPMHRDLLRYYKLGDGPLYSFYTPYHLVHFEAPLSVARVVLFGDVVMAPIGGPVVDVVATAKRDLRAGEVIDPIGYFMTYGQCENSDTTRAERLRDVPKDQTLTYDDVELPEGRLSDMLRAEQDMLFAPEPAAAGR